MIADNQPRKYNSRAGAWRLNPQPGWVAAGDLREGSTVAVYMGNGNVPYPIPDEQIKLAAYLLGDGGISTGGAVTFSQMEGPILDEFRECVETLGCDLISAELRRRPTLAGD